MIFTAESVAAFRQAVIAAEHRICASAGTSLTEAANTAFNQAQDKVPKVTGALAASGKVTSEDTPTVLRRTISYGDSTPNPRTGRATSSYATQVHEIYRSAHPNSYKWLELTVRQYGHEAYLQDLAANIRLAL